MDIVKPFSKKFSIIGNSRSVTLFILVDVFELVLVVRSAKLKLFFNCELLYLVVVA